MALKEDATAFRSRQTGEDHLKAFHHLFGHDKGMEDHLPEMGFLQVFELNDGPDLRNLNEIFDFKQCSISRPVLSI